MHLDGEKVTYKMIADYMKVLDEKCEIYNGYGPSECTIGNTIYKVSKEEKISGNEKLNSVPIGFPTGCSKVQILSKENKLVPINAIGEICIYGKCLGLGYVGKSLDEIYVENPFVKNEYMYRSGDLGKWTKDGVIEFISRKDSQIKINGFRIEINEIENVLRKCDCVKDAIILHIQKEHKDYLKAFVISNGEQRKEALNKHMKKYLPYYMIPRQIIFLDQMPVLPNGKIDRKKLLTM